MKTQNILRACF